MSNTMNISIYTGFKLITLHLENDRKKDEI